MYMYTKTVGSANYMYTEPYDEKPHVSATCGSIPDFVMIMD